MQRQETETMTDQRSTLVGVFHDRVQAEKAARELHEAGFREDQVGFLSHGRDGTGGAEAHGTEHAEPKGALAGAAGGSVVGGVLGALAAGLIPGIGPIIAGGILAGVLGGAVVGGGVGAIAGALMGMGVPEDEARYYEGEVKSGRTLVTVKTDGRYDQAYEILNRNGAQMRSAGTTEVPADQRTDGGYNNR
jgi:TM2 domain-containing membrane protein YozV